MTLSRLFWLSLGILGVVFSPTQALAQSNSGSLMSKLGPEKRTALLIGNGAYKVSEMALDNPVNDVRLMATVLRAAGFDVTTVENANRQQMNTAVVNFGQKLKRDKGIGLFFYAGHGMQVKGINYLIPTDVQAGRESSATLDSLNVGTLVDAMADANNSTNIIILDACRNDPFAGTHTASSGAGLAQMSVPAGSYVVYAAGVGQTASDGSGGNGLFTQHFARAVQEGIGRSISDVMMQVRTNVRRDSKGAQTPWDLNALETNFYFYSQGTAPAQIVDLPVLSASATSAASTPPAQIPAPVPPPPPPKPVEVAIAQPPKPPTTPSQLVTMAVTPQPEMIWRYSEQDASGASTDRVLRVLSTQDGWQRLSDDSQRHTDGRVKAWRIGNLLLQGSSEDGMWRFPLKAGATPPLSAELVKADGKALPVRLFMSADAQADGSTRLNIRADAITELLQYSAVFNKDERVPISYQAELKHRLTGVVSLKLVGQRSQP